MALSRSATPTAPGETAEALDVGAGHTGSGCPGPGAAAMPVDAFEAVVAGLNAANAARAEWWLTWISDRDRFRSLLWERLLADWQGRPAPAAGLGAWFVDWLQLAKTVGQEARRLLAARRHPAPDPQEVRTLVVTIFTPRRLRAPEPYIDEYFGALPQWLTDAGQAPLIVGFSQGDDWAAAAAAAARRDIPVATLAKYGRWSDLVRSALKAATVRFAVPRVPLPWGGDADRLVRWEIRHQRPAILEGLMVERAIERVLAAYPDARLIHMFENNAWERGSYRAARAAQPARSVIGYMHCAVLRSHRKFYFPAEERGQRPMPDAVVTTGPAAACALEAIGDYPAGMVRVGCALRGADLTALPTVSTDGKIRKNLILLEGLPSVRPAYRILLAAAAEAPDLAFSLRCHPQLPYPAVLRFADDPTAARRLIPQDSNDRLVDAVASADLVIYVSSTAIFTAIAMGSPVLRIEIDTFFNDDPLTGTDGLVRRAATPEDVLQAVAAYEAMSERERAERQARCSAFVAEYMRPASRRCLEVFEPVPEPKEGRCAS